MNAVDRDTHELLADDTVRRALQALGQRIPANPCPRCMIGRVQPSSRSGFCQPCETDHEERIKASKRRSYHRRRGIPTVTYGHQQTTPDDDGVLVGETGWKLLTVTEACEILHLARSTVNAMIARGDLRSIKIGRARRIPADAIAELVEQLERQDHDRA